MSSGGRVGRRTAAGTGLAARLLWAAVAAVALGCFWGSAEAQVREEDLTGVLDDCLCDIESIDEFNNFKIFPKIQKLQERDYFRYYKVNLKRPCPFWADDGHCSIRDCHVEPCPEKGNQSKEAFIDWARYDDLQDHFCELDGKTKIYLKSFLSFRPRSVYRPLNPLAPSKGEDDGESFYTWLEGLCLEKRVFYKLISGLHASINLHLCANYLLEVASYFERSIVDLYTGNAQEDMETKSLLLEIFRDTKSFPMHFDEKSMFAGNKKEAKSLKEEFRLHFKNISRIMDCVGCDKCRLWGKLQTQGLGTALKILFSEKEIKNLPENSPSKGFQLTRQEIVALLNAFGRQPLLRSYSRRKAFHQKANFNEDVRRITPIPESLLDDDGKLAEMFGSLSDEEQKQVLNRFDVVKSMLMSVTTATKTIKDLLPTSCSLSNPLSQPKNGLKRRIGEEEDDLIPLMYMSPKRPMDRLADPLIPLTQISPNHMTGHHSESLQLITLNTPTSIKNTQSSKIKKRRCLKANSSAAKITKQSLSDSLINLASEKGNILNGNITVNELQASIPQEQSVISGN
ncbi:hypothetical protein JD844_024883 [Phrynosoma platyrhinos]|uniref:Endoplasmic reticulum oxidoreductase 1 beta n=1 Tax=Phrynosoma platyrhinos TaxID=52577 RepID=A0ABQ7SYH8_PHRPL|nr:hypothetical protein JD844_024883 [Phrynosoma platyrhinos]